mmetsp:Transcript_31372/g.91579  ORF Transcript_31372/g.91579 Transcript_31372/m.91579 type:complete len:332 (-) Transcript_31372:252-1247(-)
MLFPLSKPMQSTRFFQSGGTHSEPVLRRQWHGTTPGAHERMYEVHRLLTEKKPFSEHLKMASMRTAELRRQDAELSRQHSATIKEMQRRYDDEAKACRREMRAGLAESRRRRSDGAEAIAAAMRDQAKAQQGARADMESRVRSMPMLGGEPPAKESAERAAQREENFMAVKARTKDYFQERKACTQRLAERPMSMSFGEPRRPNDEVIEERKAARMTQGSKAFREYEAQIESVYDKHHQRILAVLKQHKEDFQAHLDHKLAARDEAGARRTAQQRQIREELEGREERLKNRTRGLAGYTPMAKSDRRMRMEAAMEEFAASNATRRPGMMVA